LTTSGPGSFYWAAVGSQQTTPGTTINSTRTSYTGNGAGINYATGVYTAGANQVRVYIDGVRQLADYTETSGNTGGVGIVTFSAAPPSGTSILFEVDGFVVNPYYANNITFTAPQGGIVSSANTIQLAINDLESRKATIASPGLTGFPTAPTAVLGTSNTQISTTAFVNNLANSGYTFTASVTGNAGTVTNGVITTGSYANPSWITSLAWSKVSSTPTTLGGYGITDAASTSSSYANPTWITSLASTKITGTIPVANVTGLSASATTDTTNASNISSGTLSASRLPTSVTSYTVPSGGIIMWSGSVLYIPSGWFLCDGSNSTPDLRNRFIVGAGSTYSVGATGGSADAILVSHTHTATVIDPTHNHGVHYGAGVSSGNQNDMQNNPNVNNNGLTANAATGITVSNSTEGSSATNANLPPYYALAYIMKS